MDIDDTVSTNLNAPSLVDPDIGSDRFGPTEIVEFVQTRSSLIALHPGADGNWMDTSEAYAFLGI